MTREEANNILDKCYTIDYGMDTGYDINVINDLIDKIYNDFENRTCESCKDYDRCVILNALSLNGLNIGGFGCNKWQGK